MKPLGLGAAAETVTVVEALAVPPEPVHCSVNVLVAVSVAVVSEPLLARLPLHDPPAEQLLALVLDQVNVALEPLATALGAASSVTVGDESLVSWMGSEPAPPPQDATRNMNVDA